MLVLTRKLNEAIQIGDHIKVTVLRVKGNSVRIGIEAPRDIRVLRAEILRLDVSNLSASDAVQAANDRSTTYRQDDVVQTFGAGTQAAATEPTTDADDQAHVHQMASLRVILARRQRQRAVRPR